MDKKWWHVIVDYDADSESGKNKKVKEEFMVKSFSPTDVEVIVSKEMIEAGINEFEFKSLKPTKIIKILTSEGAQCDD